MAQLESAVSSFSRSVRDPSFMAAHQEECVFMPSKVGRIKELTDELSESQLEISLFFDLCPDLLCIVSSGYLIKTNQAWQKETGWTIQELTQRPLLDFVHPDDVEKTCEILDEAKSDIVKFHNRLKVKGSDKYIVLEWNAIRQSDGHIYAVARIAHERCLQCPEF